MSFDHLLDAIWNRELLQATEILRGSSLLVNQRDGNGRTALSWAAQAGDLAMVQLLVEYGADVSLKDANRYSAQGNSPLHEAAIGPFPSIVAFLLNKGANVNSVGEDNWTPIELVAGKFFAEEQAANQMMELLLANGAEVRTIAVAAAIGDIEKIQQLVSKGADPDDSVGTAERTALHIAAANGNRSVVEYLVTITQNINCEELDNRTPLDFAIDDHLQALLRKHGGRTLDENRDIIAESYVDLGLLDQMLKRGPDSPESHNPPMASNETPSFDQDEGIR